jgi:small-conductance mechanosensitive channel/CRP-like cAMP-binding protein
MEMIVVGIVLLVATLGLRGASGNRYVRGRLLVSSMLIAVYVLAAMSAKYLLSPDTALLVRTVQPLLLAFALINVVVALAINPWRSDRIPDRFPNIVQDAIVIALFGIAATLILQERILATSAVGAVVIGLALQDTLGNLFAGLAIQVEKPFRVGQWVNVAGKDGLVSEITWRATKIRTKAGNFVVVPNSALARDTITNYSEPIVESRLEVDVGVSYDIPPNKVKAVIRDAIRDEPLLAAGHEPEVLIADFAAYAVTYRIRVWTADFAADEHLRDRVRSRVYYAFRRTGVEIPYPTQVEIRRDLTAPPPPDPALVQAALGAVAILAPLSDEQRAELARRSRLREYAAGEAIVRQGAAGSSMFVIQDGEAVVTLAAPRREVAHLKAGDFFGEMSLLTGDPRSATVTAVTDCAVLEITVEDFRGLVLADPAVVERVALAASTRGAELERHRAEGLAAPAGSEPPHTFVARVRRFLHLAAS